MAGKPRTEPKHKIHFREWRLARGLTQRAVAVWVGVGENTVSYWDNGRPPQVHYLPDIAELFECTIDQLFHPPSA
ncbi:helix-turn-helix transcriptional regulator [Nonomuraea polychroma]|uniref:helix-turn-helix transcriptional regulator n=1 Tax=Nonomuraea polychroma TaxID=46176 RepID=UPI003D8C6746